MRPSGPRIIVVGAGIVGASIAYHLARRGAAVTVVDRGGAAGQATGQSFGWINVSHGMPETYHRLRQLAVQEYGRLQDELAGALPLDRCGALVWHHEPAATERFVRAQVAWGYEIRLLERDAIAALEPNLIEPPACAAHAVSEAAIEPSAACAILLDAARGAGAALRLGTEVTALAMSDRAITGIRTAEGLLGAEVVVLAAGAGTAALCAPQGVALPMDCSPAWLLRFRAPARLIHSVISSPELEIRQSSDGRLLAAEDYAAGASPDDAAAIARATLATIRRCLRGADGVRVEGAGAAMRPIPADGLPVVGFSPGIRGLYLAVMHAGVTLAPAVGRFAAAEIVDGASVLALDPCRLERFA